MEFVYRGLKAQLEHHTVTDEEVDRQMERLRRQNPRVATITNRPAQLGDEVVLDYAGFCDGEQFAGGTAENQALVLGSGMFIPGFEEQLVDRVPGEPVTVQVTFPTEYHAKELAGKAAEFHCVIHEIRVKTEYKLDDTFAKEVGHCDTFAEMRERLRASLQDYTDERGELDLQDRLIRQAAATLDFTPTEAELDAAVEEQIETLRAQLGQQGLTLEMYCQFLSSSEETLREEARADAAQSLRIQAAVAKIAELEGLDASQEEIAEACAQICRQNHMTMEQLRPHYDAAFEAAVVRSVITRKTLALVRSAAEVTETP